MLKEIASQKTLYVFDTHFDHKGMLAQTNSAKLLLTKIAALAQDNAAVLCGDFNFDRTSANYKILSKSSILKDAIKVAKKISSSAGSYNGFNINSNPESPIDHIFLTADKLGVTRYSIVKDDYQGKLPSDHYPVVTEMFFKNANPAKK